MPSLECPCGRTQPAVETIKREVFCPHGYNWVLHQKSRPALREEALSALPERREPKPAHPRLHDFLIRVIRCVKHDEHGMDCYAPESKCRACLRGMAQDMLIGTPDADKRIAEMDGSPPPAVDAVAFLRRYAALVPDTDELIRAVEDAADALEAALGGGGG